MSQYQYQADSNKLYIKLSNDAKLKLLMKTRDIKEND